MAKHTLNKILFLSAIASGFALTNACSGNLGGGGADSRSSAMAVAECDNLGTTQVSCPASAANVIPLRVGSTLTGGYQNEPVISVTICAPGSTTNCKTVDNILLDTGSYGLRLFNSVISSLNLSTVSYGGKDLAECVTFGTGSMWGPIKKADVYIGGEPVLSSFSIQAVDATYYQSSIPDGNPMTEPDCSDTDSNPNDAGYNGIIGVGGTLYDTQWANYYSCSGSSCTATMIGNMSPTLQSPFFALTGTSSSDGNGYSVVLPPLPATGAGVASGCVVLGIGTRSNNIPGSVTVLPAKSDWTFITAYDNTQYTSIIDSGTNAYAIPSTSSLPFCSGTGDITHFYCPTTTQCLTTTQKGKAGTPTKTVIMPVANTTALLSNGGNSFKNIAFENTTVNWGLPFFFGRVVYTGNSGQTATINGATQTGPYWAH